MTQTEALQEEQRPTCEVGECFFVGDINIGGKWVCQHHAPAEASYYGKHGKPYREASFVDADERFNGRAGRDHRE